jgi:hypothetical protein
MMLYLSSDCGRPPRMAARPAGGAPPRLGGALDGSAPKRNASCAVRGGKG